MDSRIFLLCAIVFMAITATSSLSVLNCPAASRIDSCSPQCKEQSNCVGAKVCCTNICGTKSCTDINQYQNGKNDKYSSSNKQGATGAYCGNTKCAVGEKCDLDRTTKRQKCVRG